MTLESFQNRRRFFRLRYSESDEPLIITCGRSFFVTEISEQGFCFYADDPTRFSVEMPIDAVLLFRNSETCPVFGCVERIQEHEIVVVLGKGIPFSRVMSEQRRIAKKLHEKMPAPAPLDGSERGTESSAPEERQSRRQPMDEQMRVARREWLE